MPGQEYKGKEIVYAVVTDELTPTVSLFWNQTDGSTSIEADEVELNTKDKTGSDYGKVAQSFSAEGVFTEGDVAVPYIKNAIRNRELVTIYEIDTRTLEAEKGAYMISSFEKTSSNGEFVTYSIEGSLNGDVTTETMTTVPEGAPA